MHHLTSETFVQMPSPHSHQKLCPVFLHPNPGLLTPIPPPAVPSSTLVPPHPHLHLSISLVSCRQRGVAPPFPQPQQEHDTAAWQSTL